MRTLCRRVFETTLLCSIACAAGPARAQDYWTPPAGPKTDASRVRTMNEIEPRTVVYSLPYYITNSGSYVLVKDLTGVANSNGIIITASDVSLDLNGFSLLGVAASQNGIFVSGTRERISIRNGGDGIDAAPGSRVTGCVVRDHTGTGDCGIRAGADCHIMNNTAVNNYNGIYEAGGAIIGEGTITNLNPWANFDF